MPQKNEDASIRAVRFVYETECTSLAQPFYHPIYVLHIVTQGIATLRILDKSYELKRGDVFFAFPASFYYLDASEDFEYIYISFMGSGAASFLSRCNISPQNPHFTDFSFLCTMFENAIRRITQSNSNILTEGVLFYALSFFDSGKDGDSEEGEGTQTIFAAIVNYVDHHFRESDLSLKRLTDVFSYTEKYLSSLFKKNMQTGFVSYLNNLRIQYACELIGEGKMSIAEIGRASGFSDYSYFSKVFKKITGKTPSEGFDWYKQRK
jgi:AraC-like DNA-binding protein